MHFSDDDTVFVANSFNALGNVSEVSQLEKSTYGFLGDSLPCLILHSGHNFIENENGEFDPVIETSGNKSDNNKILKVIVKEG